MKHITLFLNFSHNLCKISKTNVSYNKLLPLLISMWGLSSVVEWGTLHLYGVALLELWVVIVIIIWIVVIVCIVKL